jgi:DNA-directed RNA polymerase subunit RPC12/RpoP
MSDLIRRQDAIDAANRTDYRGLTIEEVTWVTDEVVKELQKLPSAEQERKKGKWIEVHGYATPGGDPVWKCSECGKGIHVYGIEAPSYNRDYTDGHQWVACPNCGADMRDGQ